MPVGYGTAFGKGDGEVIVIEVVYRTRWSPAGCSTGLCGAQRRWDADRGHAQVIVDSYIYRADASLRALLSEHEFSPGTTFNRMRIDHTGPVTAPDVPAGYVVHRGAHDDRTRRIAHDVIIDCFRGQFGFVARPHEEWLEARAAYAIPRGPSSLCSSSTGNRSHSGTAAIGMSNRELRPYRRARRDRGGAWARPGDLPAPRRLRPRRGRRPGTGTILHVDTNNPTPALHLYLSVGMRPTLVLEGWRRTMSATR